MVFASSSCVILPFSSDLTFFPRIQCKLRSYYRPSRVSGLPWRRSWLQMSVTEKKNSILASSLRRERLVFADTVVVFAIPFMV